MATLGKTLKETGFDRIFTEVSHDESLNLRNQHDLRLFHLNAANAAFSFDALHNFLVSNIGRYIYSRAQLDHFRDIDDMESVAYHAVELMKETFKDSLGDIGEELGDIPLYAFLEQILGAPKLFSKVELIGANGQRGLSGSNVHLLPISEDDGYSMSYQMIFGQSRVDGDIRDAVDAAFEALETVRDDEDSNMRMVERTLFSQHFEKETNEYLRSVILPNEQKVPLDKSFGVFLGYNLGLDAAEYSNDGFRTAAKLKMEGDIKRHVAYIVDSINRHGMTAYSFYFYILPFNDAVQDKQGIMTKLLGGASA